MEANYAYYCLHKLHMRPAEFCAMDSRERAFVIACIDYRLEQEEKAAKEAKRKRKR